MADWLEAVPRPAWMDAYTREQPAIQARTPRDMARWLTSWEDANYAQAKWSAGRRQGLGGLHR